MKIFLLRICLIINAILWFPITLLNFFLWLPYWLITGTDLCTKYWKFACELPEKVNDKIDAIRENKKKKKEFICMSCYSENNAYCSHYKTVAEGTMTINECRKTETYEIKKTFWAKLITVISNCFFMILYSAAGIVIVGLFMKLVIYLDKLDKL